MKKIVAFFLLLTSLLSLFALTGCKKQEPNNNNNESTPSQSQNSTEDNQTPDLSKALLTLETCSEEQMLKYRAIYEETGYNPVMDASNYSEDKKVYTNVVINYFYAVGFGYYRILSHEEYEDIQKYQIETGKQVIYPTVKYTFRDDSITRDNTIARRDINDANFYYLTEIVGTRTKTVLSPEGNFILNYWRLAEDEKSALIAPYNSLRIEGENGVEEDGKRYFYVYGRKTSYGIEARVFLYEYYQYLKATQPDYAVSEEKFFEIYKSNFTTQAS